MKTVLLSLAFCFSCLVQAASNENLPQTMTCEIKGKIAWNVINTLHKDNPSAEQFFAVHPYPDNWPLSWRQSAAEIVEQAVAWPDGEKEFTQWVYDNCLKAI